MERSPAAPTISPASCDRKPSAMRRSSRRPASSWIEGTRRAARVAQRPRYGSSGCFGVALAKRGGAGLHVVDFLQAPEQLDGRPGAPRSDDRIALDLELLLQLRVGHRVLATADAGRDRHL